jgi:hypothetical protein
MGYLINSGSGFLKYAIQIASNRKVYLFVGGGYQGSTTNIGYDNFGTRVLNDGAIIESYACANDAILAFPTANIGRQLFDAYNTRVQSLSGSTEARDCTITELYNLKQE